ncbi:MAG: YwiC-like family protein [Propionibacteriaceae bacterium]|nr:YwiC-like family protein [Propionibacteriaceae bacterium]
MTRKRKAGKPGGHSQGWVPNHHGAWAMLVLPYLLGLIWAIGADRFHPALLVLGPVWIIGYFAFFATATWLKSNFKPRYRPAVVTYSGIVVVLGGLLLVLKPGWWAWALVFGPLTGLGLWLAWRRRERSLLSGFATVSAASLLPLVMGSDSPVALGGLPVLPGLSLACFGYFFGTVFYVKTNVRERGRVSYIWYSVAWHAACTVLFAVVDFGLPRWWLVAFFAACTLRAGLVPMLGPMSGRKVTTKQLGYTEMIVTAVLVAILVPGVLSAG